MDDKTKLKEEIWNLHRKADQLRSMHNAIKDNYSFWSKLIIAYITVGSAITAMLIFADIGKELQFWIGVLAASIFIIGLIPSTFSFESRIMERNFASKQWGEWIRTANNFCSIEIDALQLTDCIEREKELLEVYKKIMNDTPTIPDRLFNKLKKKHLQKVEISKALDKTPFKRICSIKKELRRNNKKQ